MKPCDLRLAWAEAILELNVPVAAVPGVEVDTLLVSAFRDGGWGHPAAMERDVDEERDILSLFEEYAFHEGPLDESLSGPKRRENSASGTSKSTSEPYSSPVRNLLEVLREPGRVRIRKPSRLARELLFSILFSL